MPEHLCSKCYKLDDYGSCCKDSEIALTSGDIDRISNLLGHNDFYEIKPVADYLKDVYSYPGHCPDGDEFWIKCVFDDEGNRPAVKHLENHKCYFLDETRGCVLNLEQRPLYCRLYPFDYNEKDIIGIFEDGCPTHLLKGNTLFEELELDSEKARIWHKQLYEEIYQDYIKRQKTKNERVLL